MSSDWRKSAVPDSRDGCHPKGRTSTWMDSLKIGDVLIRGGYAGYEYKVKSFHHFANDTKKIFLDVYKDGNLVDEYSYLFRDFEKMGYKVIR